MLLCGSMSENPIGPDDLEGEGFFEDKASRGSCDGKGIGSGPRLGGNLDTGVHAPGARFEVKAAGFPDRDPLLR